MAEFELAPANQSPLAAAIRTAIGVGPDECVQVTTPTFDRPASWQPAMMPPSAVDLKAWGGFTQADRDTLRAWGCRRWSVFTTERPTDDSSIGKRDSWYFDIDDESQATHELWLLPADWYDSIPNGFPLVDIFGCIETFERGKTDDDRRFGLLAFGVMVPFRREVATP